MFSAIAILHVIFFAVGLIGGWLLKHYHIGIPTETISAVQGLLAQKHKAEFLSLIKGLNDSGKLPQI